MSSNFFSRVWLKTPWKKGVLANSVKETCPSIFISSNPWKDLSQIASCQISTSCLSWHSFSKQFSVAGSKNAYTRNTTLLAIASFAPSILQHSKNAPSINSVIFYSDTTDTNKKINNENSRKSQKIGILSAMLKDRDIKKKDSRTKSVLEEQGFSSKDDKKDEKKNQKSNDNTGSNEEESTNDAILRSQRYMKWMLIATVAICAPVFILDKGRPPVDQNGQIILDQYSNHNVVVAYVLRAWGEVMAWKRIIVEPTWKKLLPDPLQKPYYQPKYTVCLELMDVFLRPTYDSISGWRFKKRPGIDYFLSQVGPPLYEVVIFTKETGMTAFHLVDMMDKKGYIMYRLFRDSCRYKSGWSGGDLLQGKLPSLDPYYQKDLTFLNRDLGNVIMVDCDKRALETHPENGICIKEWDGNPNDTGLFDLASMLRAIAVSKVPDVRSVISHYNKFDDPLEEFKKAQLRLQQEHQVSHDVEPNATPKLDIMGKVVSFFKGRG